MKKKEMEMKVKPSKQVDEFSAWIQKIDVRSGKWYATYFPNRVVETFSFESLVKELVHNVLNETFVLACEALNVEPGEIREKGRKQERSDKRMAIAIVLLNRFDHKVDYTTMARMLGWKNHCMLVHSRNQADVTQISDLVQTVYHRFPFLSQTNYEGLV